MNSSSPNRLEDELSWFLQIVFILSIIIHCLGLVGNLLMLLVYFSGSLHKMSVSVYFRCMAVLCLFQNTYELARLTTPLRRVESQFEIVCKLSDFYFLYSKPTSAWLEILAGLDRYLTIVYPYRFKFLKRPHTQYFLITAVILYNAASYAKILFDTRLQTSYDEETHENRSVCQIFVPYELSILDFVNGAAIPFVSMSVCSILTLVGVRRAHAQIKSSLASHSSRRRTRIHDLKFGVTMIFLNILFVAFNSPYRFFYILDLAQFDFAQLYYTSSRVYFMLDFVFKLIFECYYSIVFWFQLSVNSVVRKELRGLLAWIFLRIKEKLF